MKTINILTLLLLFGKSSLVFSQTIPVKIDLDSKGNKLDAAFYEADTNAPAPAVILLHGFPGNQTSPLGLAEKLYHAGMNVLVFNYQGSYNSGGSFSFDNCIDNVRAAMNFVKEPENRVGYNIDTSRIIVCGYSFGGAIALESAIHNQEIRYVISIAGDDHSVAIKKTAADPEFLKGYKQFVSKSFGPGGSFRGNIDSVLNANIVNVDRYDLVKNAPVLKDKNIMLIVGWQDNMSLLEVNALPLYRKLMQLKAEHVTIKGLETDHSFKNAGDDLADAIIRWINEL